MIFKIKYQKAKIVSKLAIATLNGGTTELVGTYILANTNAPKIDPTFRIKNAKMSIAGGNIFSIGTPNYDVLVEETRGAKTLLFYRPRSITGHILYTGFRTTTMPIVDSFESMVPGSKQPADWTVEGDGEFSLVFANDTFDGVFGDGPLEVPFLNADGELILRCESRGNSAIYRSFDISEFGDASLKISLLVNDHGGNDGTLESGDTLEIQYAFGDTPPSVDDYATGLLLEGDVVPGENNPELFQEFEFMTQSQSGAENTLWIRIEQNVNMNPESFVVDLIRISESEF